jgi:hypothetical protein
MNFCRPFGNIDKAKILVIGHDPRLQRSDAEAQYAFFLNYLEQSRPVRTSEGRKYDFASSVVNYIRHLAASSTALEDMFFTNLCNEFLEHPTISGTVLITDDAAERGIQAIEGILSRGSFKVILSMAPQTLYHLVRLGFVANPDENLLAFLRMARPSPAAAVRGAYVPVGRSAFLMVCGRRYHHRRDGVPLVPILHAKQWPLNKLMEPHYGSLMGMAATNTRACLI